MPRITVSTIFQTDMIKQILLVGLGGGAGSILRYLVSFLTNKYNSLSFPLATFIVNISGCLIIGLLVGLSLKHTEVSPNLKLLLMTGFCGGYTTFSAFSLENMQLLQQGNYGIMITYTLTSILLGVAAVYLGYILVK